MSRSDDRRHWLLFVVLLLSTLLTVGVGGVGVGVGLLALLETGSLVAALSATLPWAVGTLLLLLVDAGLLVWTVVAAIRRLSLPRDDRLASAAERAEAELPVLRSLSLAERFEPTPEQRRQHLKERYVDGELSEAEFERRVREHVENPSALATEDPLLARVLADDESRSDAPRERDADGERDATRERDAEVE
jgi:hypothetical protein